MTAHIRAYQPADQVAVRQLIEGVLTEFGFPFAVGENDWEDNIYERRLS